MYSDFCGVGPSYYDSYIGIPSGILIAANLGILALGIYCLWEARKVSGGGATGGGGGAIQKNLYVKKP